MSLWQWSTIAANNATADPSINWQEGQAPSSVNDSARAMMAAIATWWANAEWLNLGDVPTYVSATQFTVPTNRTSAYTVGRRVLAKVTAGTVYGTVTASAFTSLTTVTVAWDSGSLDSGVSEVDLGIMNPANTSLPANFTLRGDGASAQTFTMVDTTNIFGAAIKMVGNGSTTPSKAIGVHNGVLKVANDSSSVQILTLDDSGNLSVTGNATASSDERLKTDWEPMPVDFIEHLAALKRGTFTRIDSGQRQVGVGAQSLRSFMPEAVQEINESLAVAYGQAALVACAELAAEVVRLRALLELVK